MSDFITLDEETFDDIFQLIPSPSGDMSWERKDIVDAGIINDQIWTIIEGDSGALWCVPGWHSVNVFGYAVSTVSWIDSNMQGCYMEVEPHCDSCGIEERDCSGEDWCGKTGRCVECCDEACCICDTDFMAGAHCVLKRNHDGGHKSVFKSE
jgi:hypothetical protein